MQAGLLPNETTRLRALDSYKVLDTRTERDFDNLVRLAAQITNTPIAVVSLVDRERQWFKARYGLEVSETPRRLSFCAHAILKPEEMMEVSDARKDARFADNELVAGGPKLRYYFGVPLVTPEGLALGTLCVLDIKPRRLSTQQKDAVGILARQVMMQLEVRRRMASVDNGRNDALSALKNMTAVVAEAGDAVISKTLDGTITTWNKAAESLFGYTAEQMIGKNIRLIVPPHRLGEEQELLASLKGGHTLHDFASQRLNRNGRLIDVSITLSPVRDHSGTIVGASTIVRDVSERKRVENALRESHAILDKVLSARTFGVLFFNLDGCITAANQTVLDMTGYTRDELLATSDWHRLTPRDFLEVTRRVAHDLATTGKTLPYEKQWIRKDGSRFWGLFAPARLSGTGHDSRCVEFIIDITERKRAQDSIREAEEHFRILFETSPLSTFLVDFESQRILDCNDEAAKGLGYTRKQLRQMELINIDAQFTREEIAHNLALVAEGNHVHLETRHRTCAGEIRDVLVTARALRLQGRFVDYATSVDITERKRLEADLQRHAVNLDRLVQERTTSLRESVEELEHFSYALMHDLRGPLRAMTNFAALLKSECTVQCQGSLIRKYLDRLTLAAERMDHLVLDSLNYARLLRRHVRLTPVPLLPLLRNLLETYPELWPNQAQIHLSPDLPVVLGNEAMLTEAFSNLLRNAVKFVAPGTTPHVRVWAEFVQCPKSRVEGQATTSSEAGPYAGRAESFDSRDQTSNGFVRVWVEDNGIGIAADGREQLFTMFHRLHPESEYPGTGIGLAIVRKSIERLRGQVGVESELGKGSRFWVELRAVCA